MFSLLLVLFNDDVLHLLTAHNHGITGNNPDTATDDDDVAVNEAQLGGVSKEEEVAAAAVLM